jgi:hypothetical protein
VRYLRDGIIRQPTDYRRQLRAGLTRVSAQAVVTLPQALLSSQARMSLSQATMASRSALHCWLRSWWSRHAHLFRRERERAWFREQLPLARRARALSRPAGADAAIRIDQCPWTVRSTVPPNSR